MNDFLEALALLLGEGTAYADEYPESGEVSYYTNESVDPRWGGVTKSGEKFDEDAMTMAILPEHWKEHKNRLFLITNPETGKNVVVRANDTGGFGKYNRIGDLSKGAFAELFSLKQGVGKVKISPYNKKD